LVRHQHLGSTPGIRRYTGRNRTVENGSGRPGDMIRYIWMNIPMMSNARLAAGCKSQDLVRARTPSVTPPSTFTCRPKRGMLRTRSKAGRRLATIGKAGRAQLKNQGEQP
jgi:hypothetical protein